MTRNNEEKAILFKLHVSNLPSDVTESKLIALFRKHGNPKDIYLNEAPKNGGKWAFVDYTDYDDATEAIRKLNNAPPYHLSVKLSKKTIQELENGGGDKLSDHESENEKKIPLVCRGRWRMVPFSGPPPSCLIPQNVPTLKYYRGENFDYESEAYNINFMDDDLSHQIESVSMKIPNVEQTKCSVLRGRPLCQPNDFVDEILKTRGYKDNTSNAEFTTGPSIHEIPENPKCEIRTKRNEHFFSRKGENIINSLDENRFKFKINGILGEDTVVASVEVDWQIDQNLTSKSNFSPSLGEMVYALVDSKWFRGFVTFKKADIVKVALIDVGFVIVPEALCPIPSNVQKPETAVTITFDKTITTDLIGEVFEVKNGECPLGRVDIKGWKPTIEDCGVQAVKIPTKSEVFISSFQSPKAIYVVSADPDDIIARMELTIDVFSYVVDSANLDRKPLFGEIICCRYSEDNRFYRAQVIKKKNEKYIVSFIDYGNISTVTLNDMKPLPQLFKNVPAFAVKTGLNCVSGTFFNEYALEILNIHAINRKKFILEYDSLDNATLVSESFDSLNKKLEEMQNFVIDDFFSMEHLKFEKWQIRQNLKLLGVSCIDFKSYLVIDSNSSTFKCVKNMKMSLNEYCENLEQSLYLPRKGEICLAKYEEKNSFYWCRAAFLEHERERDAGSVYLVDYGNRNSCIPLSYLRPIKPEFMIYPASCKSCEIYGLTEMSEEVKKAIESALTEAEFEGIVVDDENDDSVIFVPAVNEILSNFNIPLITPPKIIADLV